ncbi:MAG: rhomboid family intramembrane serine protease [Lachnospiraceae bacterium]
MDDWSDIFAANKKSANLIIVIVTSVVFLVLELWEKSMTKGTFYGNTTTFLKEHGALYAPRVLDGEWYRLLTYQFLHGGIHHLVNNMLVLYFLGNFVERFLGGIRYVILYFCSGILAGIGSIVYNGYILTGEVSISAFLGADGFPVCIGASGAVFGVVGAMLYLVLIHRGRLQGFDLRRLLLFIGLSLYSGFVDTGVDNAAHVAGLLGGVILAVVLYGRPKHQSFK